MHVGTLYTVGTNCNNYNVIVYSVRPTLFNVSIMAVRIFSDLTLHVDIYAVCKRVMLY